MTQTPSNEQLHGAKNQFAQYAGLRQARVSPEEYARQQYAQQQAAMPPRANSWLDRWNAAWHLLDTVTPAQHSAMIGSLVGNTVHVPNDALNNHQPVPCTPDYEPAPDTKRFGLMPRFARKPKVSAI